MPGARVDSTDERRRDVDTHFSKVFGKDHVQLAQLLQVDKDAITAINTRKALCALGRQHSDIMRFLPAVGQKLREKIKQQQLITPGNRGRPNDPRYIGEGPVNALRKDLDLQKKRMQRSIARATSSSFAICTVAKSYGTGFTRVDNATTH